MPKRATVAYENPRTNRAEAKYFAEVRQRLDAMGAPNSGELLHTSRTYVEGAMKGGVGAGVAAAVIWHQHCRTGIAPDKKDCGAEAGSGAGSLEAEAKECPSETAAECPPGNLVRTRGHGTYMVRVLTEDGGVIEIDNAVAKDVAFDNAADILKTGLVMNGKRIKIKGVKVVQRGAKGEEAFESVVSEANDSALDASKIPACAPFTQVVKDPVKFAACQARAKQIGPLEDDRKMYEFLRSELEKQDQEIFVVVGLDLHRNVRSYDEVARGQRDRVAVLAEDVIRPIILSGCHAFVVSHNHPSGSANPSKKDGELTETIREAARVAAPNTTMLDHIICGAGEYYSFTDRKLKKS